MGKICYGCMKEYDEGLDTCPFCRLPAGIPQPEPSHLTAGTMLHGRYLTGRVLGYGGFGVTYIGLDQLLGRKVAVKEYLPGEFATRVPAQAKVTVYSGEKGEQFRTGLKKFTEESRRLAKFQNIPEIVHIYDCFEENATAYIVMEYLEGETLGDRLARIGRMEYEEALPILLDVLRALEKVHAEGMLHRDVAPDNIFLTKDGRTKLIDFGAARFATTTHSRSLTVLIKPGYCPEEQYRSRGDQGTWTDVYAAAATAYRMITGIAPDDALERAVKDKLQRPSKLGVKIPKSAENAILNALNVKVSGRTQTAEAFEKELTGADTGRHKEKVRQFDIGRWPLWGRLALGLGLAAFVGIGVLAYSGVIRFSTRTAGEREASSGMTYVPNVTNQKTEEAKAHLEAAKLVIRIYDKQYSSTIPAGRVLSQNIGAGTLVEADTEVGVVVSAGIRKTEVPDLIGMEEEQALALLEKAELLPDIVREKKSLARGTVAAQSIGAGEQADTGTRIRLTVSEGMGGGDPGIQEIMDDYTGRKYREAAEFALLKYLYLINGGFAYSDTVPNGCIISQEIEAGEKVPQNTNIYVIVSRGKERVTVPDVQYKSMEEAAGLLAASGLSYETKEMPSDFVLQGHVIEQKPEGLASVDKGTKVVLTVSTAPEPEEPAAETEEAEEPADAEEREADAPESEESEAAAASEPAVDTEEQQLASYIRQYQSAMDAGNFAGAQAAVDAMRTLDPAAAQPYADRLRQAEAAAAAEAEAARQAEAAAAAEAEAARQAEAAAVAAQVQTYATQYEAAKAAGDLTAAQAAVDAMNVLDPAAAQAYAADLNALQAAQQTNAAIAGRERLKEGEYFETLMDPSVRQMSYEEGAYYVTSNVEILSGAEFETILWNYFDGDLFGHIDQWKNQVTALCVTYYPDVSRDHIISNVMNNYFYFYIDDDDWLYYNGSGNSFSSNHFSLDIYINGTLVSSRRY